MGKRLSCPACLCKLGQETCPASPTFENEKLQRRMQERKLCVGACPEGLSIITIGTISLLITIILENLTPSLKFMLFTVPMLLLFSVLCLYISSKEMHILQNFQRHTQTNNKGLSNPGLFYNRYFEFIFIREFLDAQKCKTVKYSYIYEFYLEENSSKIQK